MIRILQVIGSLNSGGSQSMIMNIYRNIDRKKIQFDFIIHKEDEVLYSEEIERLGGKIYVLPQYKVYNVFSFKKAWNDFFKKHPEYKVIHGHVRSTASIYLKIAKKYGLYTIAHSHSTSSGKGIIAIIKNILQYRIRYVADYFIGCSKESAEWLFGKKIANSDRCTILNNAIDTKKYLYNETTREKLREKFNIKKENKLIGNVGRFSYVKNHKFLIRIFEEVCKKSNNYKLILIGDGELREEIEELVKNKKLEDKVIFTGVRKDINEMLQTVDIIVMPSIYEGFPVTLVEAQAASLPCLITDTITDEVDITELIYREKLGEAPDVWANDIIDILDNFNRKTVKDVELKIKKHGYDIETTTNNIKTIYLNGIEKLKEREQN